MFGMLDYAWHLYMLGVFCSTNHGFIMLFSLMIVKEGYFNGLSCVSFSYMMGVHGTKLGFSVFRLLEKTIFAAVILFILNF